MKITTIDTGKSETLNITDPKSGIDWTTDLLGNHDALPEYDADTDSYQMSQDDYEWWSDLINRYQEADNRFYELCQELPENERNELREAAQGISVDLENYPEALTTVCDDAEEA